MGPNTAQLRLQSSRPYSLFHLNRVPFPFLLAPSRLWDTPTPHPTRLPLPPALACRPRPLLPP